jgi:TPR repeat protein
MSGQEKHVQVGDNNPKSEKRLNDLRQAVIQGNIKATFELANMYLHGRHVPQDIPKAVDMHMLAIHRLQKKHEIAPG